MAIVWLHYIRLETRERWVVPFYFSYLFLFFFIDYIARYEDGVLCGFDVDM